MTVNTFAVCVEIILTKQVLFFNTSPIALLETIQRANNIEILYKIWLKFSFQFHTARAQPRPNSPPF